MIRAGTSPRTIRQNTQSVMASGRRADRRHVEVGDAHRGHARPREVVGPLARKAALARTRLGDSAEQVDRTLVEAEVVHAPDDLALLDEVHAVAGEAGQEQGLGVDLADVPETREQQPTL